MALQIVVAFNNNTSTGSPLTVSCDGDTILEESFEGDKCVLLNRRNCSQSYNKLAALYPMHNSDIL